MDKVSLMFRIQRVMGYVMALSDTMCDEGRANVASSLANVAKELDGCLDELDEKEETESKSSKFGFLTK